MRKPPGRAAHHTSAYLPPTLWKADEFRHTGLGDVYKKTRRVESKKGPPSTSRADGGPLTRSASLDVAVEVVLIGVRTQFHRVYFPGALVVDPGVDDVRREDPALKQVVVILLECVQDFLKRARS